MSTPINGSSRPYTATVEDSARSSDNEGTMVNEGNGNGNENQNGQFGHHLTISTSNRTEGNPARPSPSQTREQRSRLEDDLEMLRAEQVITTAASTNGDDTGMANSHSVHRSRSRRSEPVDDFDVATNPLHEKAAVYRPPDNPTTKFAKVLIRIHNSSFLIRYFTYIVPLVALLLVPLLLGALVFKRASVGGVYLLWFSVWLEIVWLTLWAGRILAKALPWPIGMISSVFTNNSKKWRDLGRQLEVPATIFFWWLAIQISFLPTMKNHHVDGNKTTRPWEATMNKIIGAIFIGTILNFVEKIIIQLIAISFHLRTYADRIEINKFQIASLVKLYTYSKEKIQMEDSDFEQADVPTGPSSGTRTPMAYINEARKGAKDAMTKVGDVAGKVAGDFTGKQVAQSNHPHQVVLMLLSTTSGSQVLARRLYRTFAREETETVFQEDLKNAFGSDDEAEAAFQMFDKDLNGDISMEELEACCADVGRERKSITASLADLDSVVSKLDNVLFFVVLVITLLVFISLVSASAAGVLTSAGSTVLALSWLFAATAQEFLQSVIFVFVKHPFDVGDRVSIYGNTGSQLKGDDYFVKEIALLYTEFKKMEGQVVQAPNSYLNTLFILNMRRSGGLAEAVPVVIKFGTTLEQIEGLRNRLLEFVTAEKREYAQKILTELRDVTEAHSLTLNIVFFYKSNWQNELLRLQRRNKFICAMMVSMQELGIEGPRMRLPGQKEDTPMYLHSKSGSFMPGATSDVGQGPDVDPQPAQGSLSGNPTGSILKRSGQGSSRLTGESMSAYSRRVDFSLGMRDMSAGDLMGDIHEERSRPRVPIQSVSPSRSQFRRTSTEDNLARTTSYDTHSTLRGGTGRVSSDSQARLRTSQSQSTHRNRFFGRSRPEASFDGNRSEADLEAGTAMTDIPESGPSSSSRGRLDPRSGLVSPQAIYSSTTPTGVPIISGGAGPQSFVHPYVPQQQQQPQPPVLSLSHVASQGNGVVDRQGTGDIPIQGRAAEDYEMRRFS